jgi:hypothetical protein
MTEGLAPPPGAVVLFDGKDLSKWTARSGGPSGWRVGEGAMTVVARTGDLLSKDLFSDHYLHLEFMCPNMPDAKGQAKGNSGVYLQGRYEVQVLDSYGIGVPGKGDCGAFYNQFAPLQNACRPPEHWQTYDIFFRSARLGADGKVVEHARATVLHNGLVIQNNVELPGVSGGPLDDREGEPGPLRLQDHGNPVKYRNIWVLPLKLKGSDKYEPG